MSVRNELSDFEIEEFFGSLQELLVSSINNEYLSFDSAEFMLRRLDGYERTLKVFTLRIQESAPLEEQLISDLHILLSLVSGNTATTLREAVIQFIFRRRTECD